jgi:hypothetical protein
LAAVTTSTIAAATEPAVTTSTIAAATEPAMTTTAESTVAEAVLGTTGVTTIAFATTTAASFGVPTATTMSATAAFCRQRCTR